MTQWLRQKPDDIKSYSSLYAEAVLMQLNTVANQYVYRRKKYVWKLKAGTMATIESSQPADSMANEAFSSTSELQEKIRKHKYHSMKEAVCINIQRNASVILQCIDCAERKSVAGGEVSAGWKSDVQINVPVATQ